MLVLHVGPHKTATTWLQHNFHANIKALEGAGWYYPQTGVRVRVAHHDLSDNPDDVLNPKSAKVAELKRIAAKASEKNLDILLSSEGFRNWNEAQLKALQAIVAPHAMHIVYCLRDPATVLYSFWAQQIRTGSKNSFPEFREKQFARPKRSKILNPLTDVRMLTGIEGVTVSLMLYDEIARQKRDIFDVFVEDILKLEKLPHSEDARGNDRQPLEMTEFMRLVLIRLGTWEEQEVNIGRVFHYMMPRGQEEAVVRAVSAVPEARRVDVIDRGRPIFMRVEQELLAEFREIMVPQPEGGHLFKSGPQECPYYDTALLEADPAVASLLDKVANTFRPGGLRMWVMGWSRFWLSLYRRIMKFFRR